MSKGSDVQIEHAGKAKTGGGFKRHCARRWWVYVIAFIVVALAVVLGILFGAVPKIAQKTVDKSVLTVQGVSITRPSNTRFIYGQNATVNGHVAVKAKLSSQTIAMYLPKENEEPKPFMYLDVEQLDLADEFHINVANYDMEIADKDAFLEFTKMVLGEKEVPLALKSRPQIITGALKNKVNYNKRVTLKGFNKLEGISLSNSRILDEPEEDGTNMLSELFIPNPSDFTLEVGNLTCNFASHLIGDLGIGVVRNLVINRGDNRVEVRAVLKPEHYESELVRSIIPVGGVNVTVSGNSTVYNGEHISWLEIPLGELPLEVPIKASN